MTKINLGGKNALHVKTKKLINQSAIMNNQNVFDTLKYFISFNFKFYKKILKTINLFEVIYILN